MSEFSSDPARDPARNPEAASPNQTPQKHRDPDSFAAQVHRNLVALISLTLAIVSLAYNTWRNETTEAQRNYREAGFIVLEEIGRLQQVVDQRFYAGDDQLGDTITGWGHVLMIRDLTSLMPEPAPATGQSLYAFWQASDPAIRNRERSVLPELERQLMATREDIITTLRELE